MQNKILSLINKHTESELTQTDILQLDSLSLLELIHELEHELNMMIPDSEIENIKTVQDIIDVFSRYV